MESLEQRLHFAPAYTISKTLHFEYLQHADESWFFGYPAVTALPSGHFLPVRLSVSTDWTSAMCNTRASWTLRVTRRISWASGLPLPPSLRQIQTLNLPKD